MATYETQSSNGAPEGFASRVENLGSSAQKLWSDARSTVTDLTSSLDLAGRVDRHPYGMVAAALGVGYVLGGGLFTPLTARILRLGIRLAALPFVKEELVGLAEAAVDGLSGKAGSGPPRGQGPQS